MEDLLVDFYARQKKSSIIKIIGVGGGGSNTVEYMYSQGIKGVDFVICNTEKQDLEHSNIPTKIQLGTRGLGAGNNPEVARQAAIESLDAINEVLQDNTEMVFIIASMGAGTGTGAAPVIAKAAKDLGILTVSVITTPYQEGEKRAKNAIEGVKKLKETVDSLLIIDIEKLMTIYRKELLSNIFDRANDVAAFAAKGIAEIITLHGYINVDFEDVKTVMKDSGVAVMGMAVAEGEDRGIRAIRKAINFPLLKDNEVNLASKTLLNITYGEQELSLNDMYNITDYVNETIGAGRELIWGIGQDKELKEKISVTIITTGFKESKIEKEFDDSPVEKGKPVQLELNIVKPEYIEQLTDLSDEELDELDRVPAYIRRGVKLSR